MVAAALPLGRQQLPSSNFDGQVRSIQTTGQLGYSFFFSWLYYLTIIYWT
jgi:hypothetical protein